MSIAVVGANRGIGLEIVRNLCQQGEEVFAFCRKSSSELEGLNPKKIMENFEVTDAEKMQNLLNQASLPKLDQLFHVSGILRSSSFEDLNPKNIEEQFLVNSLGPILSVQAFLPYLNTNAKIGLLTSRMGSIADNSSGGSYGYRMSKAALNAAGKSLSLDLKDRGHTVLLLHPGWVRTEMTRGTGHLEADESASGLIEIMNSKTIEDSGTFWHVSGEELPW